MRVNFEWLRDWVDPTPTPRALADELTTLGLEVETIERAGRRRSTASSSREVARASRAIRTRIAFASAASTTATSTLQVVCGAPNVAAGIKAPFAPVGARLPGGKAIGAAELRGVESHGMLCSAKELGLGDDRDGLLLLEPTRRSAMPLNGLSAARRRDLRGQAHAEPRRLLQRLGIARELARAGRSAAHAAPQSAAAAGDQRRGSPVELPVPEQVPALRGARGPRHRPQCAGRRCGWASDCGGPDCVRFIRSSTSRTT